MKKFFNIKSLVSRARLFFLALMLAISATIANLPISKSAHAAVGSITEYNLPTSGGYDPNPQFLTVGPDNNIWYTGDSQVGKISPAGITTKYTRPNSHGGITTGSDGNLWYSEQYSSGSYWYWRIVNATTSGTILGQYNLPNMYAPLNLTLGADGDVWFIENTGSYNKIGKITVTGVITEYYINYSSSNPVISGITAGPDGNIWFTVYKNGSYANGIGKITSSGSYTIYSIPPSYNAQITGITTGPDGNLWFTEYIANKVGKMTTSGAVTEYSLLTSGANPYSITTGSDGSLWFTERGVGKIGRITTAGVVSEYAVSDASYRTLNQIITGPDGAVWFINNNEIGRVATELTSQTISFTSTAPTNAVIDGTAYMPTASATSGLPVAITVDSSSSSVCSIDGSGVVSYQAAGTCVLNANQGGNVDYKPAPQVQQSFTVLPVNADTSVALSCPTTASIGSTVTCAITVTNNGPASAENVGLTVAFPGSLTSPSVSGGGAISGQYITWSTPSLASGASTTLTFNGTTAASAAGKARINAALVQTSPDPNSSDNFVNATISIN